MSLVDTTHKLGISFFEYIRDRISQVENIPLTMSSPMLAQRARKGKDLKVKNMVKNHCLAKSINDAAWYQFREWMEYFSGKYGRQYIAVAPHYTSQNCSSCGAVVKKSLSTRTHKCSCGCEIQRDVNAAINILNKARRGHPQSNARGVATSTLLGENLVEQVATVNRESHGFLDKPSVRNAPL